MIATLGKPREQLCRVIAGADQKRIIDFEVERWPEAPQTRLAADQGAQLPTLNIGLDEVQPLKAGVSDEIVQSLQPHRQIGFAA
jgi:hypothetical protein